jgi:hypothetical protein
MFGAGRRMKISSSFGKVVATLLHYGAAQKMRERI